MRGNWDWIHSLILLLRAQENLKLVNLPANGGVGGASVLLEKRQAFQ
jgi:hypothetical protein